MVFLLVFGTNAQCETKRFRHQGLTLHGKKKKKYKTTAVSLYSITLKRKRTCYSIFKSKLLENKYLVV